MKFLDNELEPDEEAEFQNLLLDADCAAYFKKATLANEIIVEGFKSILAKAEKKQADIIEPCDELDEEIIHDMKLYGRNIPPEIHAQVDEMHAQLLKSLKRKRLIIYFSVGAVILIGLILIYFFLI